MAEMEFIVETNPDALITRLEAVHPENPFATSAFLSAKERLGCQGMLLGLKQPGQSLSAGCLAFLQRGRLNTQLEIPSLPKLPHSDVFWQGLQTLCKELGVTNLTLDTFASPDGTQAPSLGRKLSSKDRAEFVIDLKSNIEAGLGKNHSRNAKKATKAGVQLRRSSSQEAASMHKSLMELSLVRRGERGEEIATPDSSPVTKAFLESGSGELFQAILNDEIVSSVLIILSNKGGYYYSAGTSPEGMAVGASHFLISGIAQTLKNNDLDYFNLGGADRESSLERFKLGFGTTARISTSSKNYVGPAWKYMVKAILQNIAKPAR